MDIATKALVSTAIFSDCQKYRYTLRRKFFEDKPKMINFIMLNPSTATEQFNDPTVARCETMAIQRGFGSMVVTNIFAYRATDPLNMRAMKDGAVGVENDKHIVEIAKEADFVVCAWGNHGNFLERGKRVRELLLRENINMHCIKISGQGQPVHPLYQKLDSKFVAIAA